MKYMSNLLPFVVVGLVCAVFMWGYSMRTDTIGQANAAYAKRDYQKAIPLYEQKELDLKTEEALRLVYAYEYTGQETKAVRLTERLKKEGQISGEELGHLHHRLAKDAAESGEVDVAVSHYERAMTELGNQNEGLALKKEFGKYLSEHPSERTAEQGVKMLLEISRLPKEEKDPDLYFRIGNLIEFLGDTEFALRYWEKSLSLSPDNEQVQMKVVFTLLDNGLTEEADSRLSKMKHKYPHNAEVHTGLGEIAEKKGRPAVAKESYIRAISLDGNLLRVRMKLATLYENEGNKTAAIDQYYQIVRRSPESKEAGIAQERLDELTPKVSSHQ